MVRFHMRRRQAAPSLDAQPTITYAMAQLPLLLAELAALGHPIRRAFASSGRSRP
jgi:hypothetical protein